MQQLNIALPNLADYREAFLQKGVTLPLKKVPHEPLGLLQVLPTTDDEKIGWPWTIEYAPSNYAAHTDWPKLTIVTPSYGQGEFIEQTIRSVLLQNYPNLEFIIIDGGSTDETVAIIKKYDNWISYWQSEKDRGQGHAINLGFSLASGSYFAWLNSDDYYAQGTLAKVVTEFNRTKANFIYGYAQDYLTREKKFNSVNKMLPVIDLLIRFPTLAQPSCFWRAEIHQPIWEELHCSIDYELWLRILKGQKRSLIKEVLSITNVHPDAKTSDIKMKERWHQDHLLICGKDAHGPVRHWGKLNLLNRVRNKFYRWFT